MFVSTYIYLYYSYIQNRLTEICIKKKYFNNNNTISKAKLSLPQFRTKLINLPVFTRLYGFLTYFSVYVMLPLNPSTPPLPPTIFFVPILLFVFLLIIPPPPPSPPKGFCLVYFVRVALITFYYWCNNTTYWQARHKKRIVLLVLSE